LYDSGNELTFLDPSLQPHSYTIRQTIV